MLPSNVKAHPPNITSRYKTHLPQKLMFGGPWEVGLHSILMPISWASVGAMKDQHIDVYLKDGRRIRAAVPRGSYHTPEELERALRDGVAREMERRLHSGAGSGTPSGAKRSKRSQNDTKLGAALRVLWKEWDDMGQHPQYHVPDDPNKMMIRRAYEVEIVRRPQLPEGYEYRIFRQTHLPNGKWRNYVDIVNVEEDRRKQDLLKAAQDVLDGEAADPGSIMFSTLTHYAVLDPDSAELQADGTKRKNRQLRDRPPLPPGYRYVYARVGEGDEAHDVVRIEASFDDQEAAGHTTEASRPAKRPPDETFEAGPQDSREVKSVKHAEPREEAEEPSSVTHGSIVEFEEPAPFPQPEEGDETPKDPVVRDSMQTSEETFIKAPSDERLVLTVESGTQTEAPPPVQEQVIAKTPFKRQGEPLADRPDDMSDEEVMAVIRATRFVFEKSINRFRLETDPESVRFVAVSPQLGFTLGYERGDKIMHDEVGLYAPDMRGGIDNVAVYCNIAENVILGDRTTSLLRVIGVNGRPGDMIEKTYDTPIYSRINHKEVSDIEIEVRSLSGRLIPFEYGVVVVTLQFRKLLYY